jgi:hypothetical protein
MSSELLALLERELYDGASAKALGAYLGVVGRAMELEPPPFQHAWYGDSFRHCAVNPYWMIQCLISNSVKEGSGARDLWDFAERISRREIQSAVRKHAHDEARHAKLYVAILRLTFPNALSPDDAHSILERAPTFAIQDLKDHDPYSSDQVFDLLVQINLGEFRTRIHQLLMQPILEQICSDDRRPKLDRLMASIARDELHHLRYTAQLIDQWIQNEDRALAAEVVRSRLRLFNEITTREVGTQVFSA